MADLSPEDQGAALDELVLRLETRPDAFLSQSDLGQNIPFIADHLAERDEHRRVQAIVMNAVEQGLDRAYVLPFLSERLLADGDYDGIDRLVEIQSGRPAHREEHVSTLYIHAALADLIRGDIAQAIRRHHIGQWFAPLNQPVIECFWYMASMGHLQPSETYPFDPSLLRKTGRIFKRAGRGRAVNPAFDLLDDALKQTGAVRCQYPANLEVRDWSTLHGKKRSFRFASHAKIDRQIEALSRAFRKDRTAPAFHSARGALFLAMNKPAQAEDDLQLAVHEAPDTALYHKRLADLHLGQKQPEIALPHLEKAMALSNDHLCYRMELALAYREAGERTACADLMSGIAGQETGLIEIRLLVAEHMARSDKGLQSVPKYLDEVSNDAPGSPRIMMQKAKALEKLGRFEESLDHLRRSRDIGRSAAVIRNKTEGLFKAYRRAHDDAAARQWCADHRIDADFNIG